MPVQTTYGAQIVPAYEGMIANTEDQTVKSMQVETAAGIGFGKVVVQGTQDDQARISEATKPFRGISVSGHFGGLDSLQELWAQYQTMPVLIQGVVWVVASVAVAVGDPAYYVPATGALTNVLTGNTLIPRAIWESSTTGPGFAKLRIQ